MSRGRRYWSREKSIVSSIACRFTSMLWRSMPPPGVHRRMRTRSPAALPDNPPQRVTASINVKIESPRNGMIPGLPTAPVTSTSPSTKLAMEISTLASLKKRSSRTSSSLRAASSTVNSAITTRPAKAKSMEPSPATAYTLAMSGCSRTEICSRSPDNMRRGKESVPSWPSTQPPWTSARHPASSAGTRRTQAANWKPPFFMASIYTNAGNGTMADFGAARTSGGRPQKS